MVDQPTNEPPFPRDRYVDPETALGGADAVEKTTYVAGKGTDPDAQRHGATAPRVPSGVGRGTTWILLAFLAVAAVLVYLLAVGR